MYGRLGFLRFVSDRHDHVPLLVPAVDVPVRLGDLFPAVLAAPGWTGPWALIRAGTPPGEVRS